MTVTGDDDRRHDQREDRPVKPVLAATWARSQPWHTPMVTDLTPEGRSTKASDRSTSDRVRIKFTYPHNFKNDFSPMFAKTMPCFQWVTAARFVQKRGISTGLPYGYKPLKSSLSVTFKAAARACTESSRGTATPRSIRLIVPRSIPLAVSRSRSVSPRALRRVRNRALKVTAGCFPLLVIPARILLSEYACAVTLARKSLRIRATLPCGAS